MFIFPVEIGRVEEVRDDVFPCPEHLVATLEANFPVEGMPEEQSGSLKISTLLPGEFSEQPLRHLEQLADEALADALEAIASELRKRARSPNQ